MTDSFTAGEAGSPVHVAPAPSANGATASEASADETSAGVVGRVAGTEDSTPLQFAVALDEASYLQLDDVVVTVRQIPGVGPVLTSGIVTQVRARHEGASFGSDVFLISDGVLPARVQEIAEVSTTRVEPEVYVPPRPGEIVRRATGAERAQALYFDQMTAQGAGRPRPRRRADLRQPGVPRRHPRRARVDQRHLRAWRPRPASRCSCCTRSSAPVSSAPARSTPRPWCSA